jgi:hypothetical protein
MPYISRPAAGQIVDPAWGTLVADAVVMRFSTAAQRTSQLTAPVTGQLTALDTAPGVVDYWTGSAWALAAGGAELAVAQITANVVITNLSAAGSQLVVAAPALVYDGRPVLIEFFSPNVLTPSVASGAIHLLVADGGTQVAEIALVAAVSQISTPVHARLRITPTAASHTYQVFAWVSAGTGQVNAGTGTAGSMAPAVLRITRA